jgi:colanic acid/amylovoran biosynthesis glycosyltransferase
MVKTCIAYPNQTSIIPETFIINHKVNIQHDFTLSGGRWPYIDNNNKSIFIFPLSINIIRGTLKWLMPNLYQQLYTFSLSKYLVKNNIKVILAEYGMLGASMVMGCKKANADLIVHYHGFDASNYSVLKKYKKGYLKLSKYAKKIVVVSEDMQKELVGLGMAPDKIINIPYGIDTGFFAGANPSESSMSCIFIGRFTAKKAPDKIVLAFNEVLKQLPDAKLIMIGNGELLEETKNLAKNLNIFSSIDFIDFKPQSEIKRLLQNARFYVQHSVRAKNGDAEGTPNTILEASATGLPIVSTRHAGIKQAVVHEKTGYLVNEGDYMEMAFYMVKLFKNKDLAHQMGKAAREHISLNYFLKTQIDKLKNILYS